MATRHFERDDLIDVIRLLGDRQDIIRIVADEPPG